MRGRKNQGKEITDTHPNVENSVPDKAFLSKIYGIYNIYIYAWSIFINIKLNSIHKSGAVLKIIILF